MRYKQIFTFCSSVVKPVAMFLVYHYAQSEPNLRRRQSEIKTLIRDEMWNDTLIWLIW